MKKVWRLLFVTITAGALLAGCGSNSGSKADTGTETATELSGSTEASVDSESTITIFAAKSLNSVMEDLIAEYEQENPNVKIVGNYDSSGTLMTQIEEGASCDVFFSAAQSQMDELETKGLLVDGTRHNVVNNQVCVVTYKGSNTKVTGLEDIATASSIALADGSVPVGKYTRQAMVNAGMLEQTQDDVSLITTAEISDALGGVEINECANVGAVTAAVAEGSNEVGTIYYSDLTGYEDKLDILEVIPYDLTGNVIYPIAQTVNGEADDAQAKAAKDFVEFLISDKAKEVYKSYNFDTDVED